VDWQVRLAILEQTSAKSERRKTNDAGANVILWSQEWYDGPV